ncbi:MAG: hypothetical protein A2X99_07540 [Deltaproteobacteria bacterium GWB2_55_19]|nr:MAG: hypothetical protein A2X99_07540 [Deltaproteobacteria bacterium GWB2_55_19]HAO93722.1 hypothetical protein [Deltaproteobacteria bacterium]
MKKIFLSMLLLILACGCSPSVKKTISPGFSELRPAVVAVMPVEWASPGAKEDADIAALFRKLTAGKLKSLNYAALPLEEVDAKGTGSNADAFLYIHIKDWDRDSFAGYVSLRVDAAYEMYSKDGVRLWSSEYSTKESDLSLDERSREYGVFGTYEPRIDRLVEALLSTLPPGEAAKTAEKKFFQWLP